MTRTWMSAALVAGLLVASRGATAQESAFRFEIQAVNDSTFTFNVGAHQWIGKGMKGIAVDPRRRDVLVARFSVLKVENGVATSLITGETTKVTAQHVALIERTAAAWYKRGSFWAGAVAGLAVGVMVGKQ
jgi:hypothetical protein